MTSRVDGVSVVANGNQSRLLLFELPLAGPLRGKMGGLIVMVRSTEVRAYGVLLESDVVATERPAQECGRLDNVHIPTPQPATRIRLS